MAFTFTQDTPKTRNIRFTGGEKIRNGLGNLGNPYATNGIAITPAMFGLRTIDHVDVGGCSVDGAILVMYDKANQKVKAFTAVGTEAGAVDLSAAAKSFRMRVHGQ